MGIDNKDLEPKSIKIQFGTIFVANSDQKNIEYVIVDPATQDFYASRIIHTKDKEMLGGLGTFGVRDIQKVTGLWTKERVIKAYENHQGGKISPEYLKLVEDCAAHPPRVISIT